MKEEVRHLMQLADLTDVEEYWGNRREGRGQNNQNRSISMNAKSIF